MLFFLSDFIKFYLALITNSNQYYHKLVQTNERTSNHSLADLVNYERNTFKFKFISVHSVIGLGVHNAHTKHTPAVHFDRHESDFEYIVQRRFLFVFFGIQ